MATLRYFFIFLLLWVLVACSSTPAPVIDRMPAGKSATAGKSKPGLKSSSSKIGSDWRPDTYIVKKGDTLFSIGLEHGYDYKEIAQANNIGAPYTIKIGQTLKLGALKDKTENPETKSAQEQGDGVVTYPINAESTSSTTNTTPATPTAVAISEPKAVREPYSDQAFKTPLPAAKPVTTTPSTKPGTTAKAVADKAGTEIKPETETKAAETKPDAKAEPKPNVEPVASLDWAWPTKGKVIANFNDGGNKGIDIAGSKGQPIQAAASGKVIYSGSDLRGYGKLVIVKHNNTYLSVYANNSAILVKEGQQVSRGQKIAEMGDTDSNTVKLHFEIRQQGKSVDPTKFLASN